MKKALTVISAALAAIVITGCAQLAQVGPLQESVAFDANGKPVTISAGLSTNVLTVGASVNFGAK